jgi:undecaprenyl-diphosphatase
MDSFLFASVYSFALRNVWTDSIIIFFAAYWEYVVPIVLLFYLWSPKFNKAELKSRALIVGVSVFSAIVARFGFASLIRYFYPRQRPFVFEGVDALITQNPLEASFPSGHATFFMAIAVYLLLAGNKKLGWFMFASAILIGVARVSAAVHWPSDVIAGWILGAGVSYIIFMLTKKYAKK